MMRELRKIKQDGLLQAKGRQILLNESFLAEAGIVDKF